ncbi:steroid delta-isomerase [Brevibacillus borstelensis AK1]|uniref:Steroid delta-isomerase n=1 Tax=Brevibacillus borstelensis AK1 TaxID=1300222 RepID=M8E827_9BACL|nr:nuclear transport factor 2 family protein [Brevibacillus borstelensis]EMT51590.1 steroid delta-isomerase [Brevibacillus borstelensis AK1]
MNNSPMMKQALLAYVDAFNAGDAERLLALFAEEATVEDPVGLEPKRGRAEFEQFFRYAISGGAKLELVAPPRASFSNHAAVTFIVHTEMEGRAVGIHVTDVMTFDENGKIVHMRAFWGQDDVRTADSPNA